MEVHGKDLRKDFILTTSGNFFGLSLPNESLESCRNNPSLNNFLDDGSCFTLCVTIEEENDEKTVFFSNKAISAERKNTILVFFKLKPQVITGDNIHEAVFISSMFDSPVSSLYHTIQKVFAPSVFKDDSWGQVFDPKLQQLISQLEQNLKRVLLKQNPRSDSPVDVLNLSTIISLEDELQFWSAVAKSTEYKEEKSKAQRFLSVLKLIEKDLGSLDSVSLQDGDTVLDDIQNALDDLWKLEDIFYPQQRMEHLMELIGNEVTRCVQSKFRQKNLWSDSYIEIEEMMNQAISVCDKWVEACQNLTTLFWPNYKFHPWRGSCFTPSFLIKLKTRLQEILQVRTMHRQLVRLLSSSEQESLRTKDAFLPFSGINPVQFNPYTDPLWQVAIKRFEDMLSPAEAKVASKLRGQLSNLASSSPLQLLQEFKRYLGAVERPSIARALLPLRENLLASLMDYINSVEAEVHKSEGQSSSLGAPLSLPNMPKVVSNIYWARQLETKVDDIDSTSSKILSDLNGYNDLHTKVDEVRKELKEYSQGQFDEWMQDISYEMQQKTLSGVGVPLEFDSKKCASMNFYPRDEMSLEWAKVLRFNEFKGNALPPGDHRTQKEEKSKHGSPDEREKFAGSRQRRAPRSSLHGGHSSTSPGISVISPCTTPGEEYSDNQDCSGDVSMGPTGNETSEHDESPESQAFAGASGSEIQSHACWCSRCDYHFFRCLKKRLRSVTVVGSTTSLKEIVMKIASKQEFVLKMQKAILKDISHQSLHPHKRTAIQKGCQFLMTEIAQCKKYVTILKETISGLARYNERFTPLENANTCQTQYELRMAMLEKTNEELKEKAAKLQIENMEYKESIRELTNEIDEITTSRVVIDERHLNLRREMRANFIEICSLKSAVKRLESDLDIEMKRNEASGEDYMKLLEEVSIMNADEHERRSEVELLRSELEIAKKDMEDYNFARLDLVNKIRELKDRYDKEVNNLICLHGEEKKASMEEVELDQSELNTFHEESMRKDSKLSVELEVEKNLRDHSIEKERNAVSSKMDSLQLALQACDIVTYINPCSSGEQESDSPGRESPGHGFSTCYNISSSQDSKLKWMTELCAITGEKLAEYKEAIRQLEIEREENLKTIRNLEELIGPFRSQLEYYKQERSKYRTIAKQAEEKLEELETSQVEMFCHQNSMQMNYLSELDHANLMLQDVVKESTDELNQKERTILQLAAERESAEIPIYLSPED